MPGYTDDEITEAGDRARAERKKQGLPASITDAAVLAPLARAFNEALRRFDELNDFLGGTRGSDPPFDDHALRAKVPTA